MKLSTKSAPYIQSAASAQSMMLDVTMALLALYVLAFFMYGVRALLLGLLSLATCWVCEGICCGIQRKRWNLINASPIVTALLIPLMLSASAPLRMVVVADVFAICVVKQAFGGTGCNLFNPAAGGAAFALANWSRELLAYPQPFSGSLSPVVGPGYHIFVGGVPTQDFQSLVLGIVPGPMGSGNIMLLLAILLMLWTRKTVRIGQSLAMLATVAVWSAVFPLAGTTRLMSLFYELSGTSMLFYIVFLFNDPVTTPQRTLIRIPYGILSGIVLMAFHRHGAYELSLPFAVLTMNALTPLFDAAAEAVTEKGRRWGYSEQPEAEEFTDDGEL